jgi:ubiquinone biosynthesis protein COQ4
MADDTPYLLRGVSALTTESSVLISSSAYLNDWRLRDWVAMAMLRRNAPNNPFSADSYSLNAIMEDLQDFGAIDAAFEAERANNPALDRWLEKRFLHSLCKDDFKAYPAGTLGGEYWRYLEENGFGLDIREPWVPTGHFSYLRRRAVQVHDWDHILCGGSFDAYGELIPYYVRLTNVFKFLPPALAKEACATAIFGAGRIMTRTMLHYPECWTVAVDAMQRGIAVGQASDCLFMADYEGALGMPLEEAREYLGVRAVQYVDTGEASIIFMEEV